MANEDYLINENQIPSNLAPVDAPPVVAGKVSEAAALPPTSAMPPFFSGSLPPQLQLDSNFSKAEPGSTRVPRESIMPLGVQGNPASNAAVISTSKVLIQEQGPATVLETNGTKNSNQALLNLKQGTGVTLTSAGDGSVTMSALATGDGLTHGRTPWETDPSFVEIREDFFSYNNASYNPNGTIAQAGILGWTQSGTGASYYLAGGFPPYLGQICWENTGTTNQFVVLVPNPLQGAGGWSYNNSWPLLDYAGWQATWIWKLDAGLYRGTPPNFTTTKKSFYVGLAGSTSTANAATPVSPRPDIFIGLRYDTSVTPGTLTLSSVATSSGGTAVYTGTITGGANGAHIGMTFVVTGFTTGANNGTFVCTNSTASNITLNNASAVAETHAATAAGPTGTNDSTYKMEVVENGSYNVGARHNLQGTVVDTTHAPTAGEWCRLDINCFVATGQVTMNFITDGGTNFSHTFTVPTFSATSPAGFGCGNTGNPGTAFVDIGGGAPGSGNAYPPFAQGSKVTISGLTGGNAVLNGTQTIGFIDASAPYLMWKTTGLTTFSSSGTITGVGYPALVPWIAFGNDDNATNTADQMRIFVDYFGLIWNPNLGPSAPGTPNSLKPRFW